MLTATAHGHPVSAPIYRGKYVRDVLLCEPPPAAPVDVPDLADTAKLGASEREQLAAHSNSDRCSPCHRLMDPIGFGLGNFDAIGVWRTNDSTNKPVDARGSIFGFESPDFVGPVELAKKLAASPKVSACVAKMFFRYSQGRDTAASDQCTVDGMVAFFQGSGNKVQEMMLAFIKSDAFRYRQPISAQKGVTP
jgi:hypothetical protein